MKTIIFTTLICFKLIFIGYSIADTFFVSPNGDDAYNLNQAKNPDTPWNTITHAADLLISGDTLIVKDGTYYESEIQFANSGSQDG